MTRDPLERLRDADPLAGQAVPDASDPAAIAMRDAITAGTVTSLDRARRRRRWVAGVAVAAAAAATAAAVAVSTSRVTDPTSIGCYDGASTAANTTILAATEANPVEQCRQLWVSGDMDPAVTGPAQVPPLVACVLDTAGVVGVFPAGSCEDVDVSGTGELDALDTPTSEKPTEDRVPDASPEAATPPNDEPTAGLSLPDYGTDDQEVRLALDEIRLAMLDRCLSLDAAITLAEDVLAQHGLEGWTVGPIFDDQPDQTCAGFFPDASERAVWFTPEEPQPGQTPEPS